MASTVLVKLPTVPFPQGKVSSPDIMPLTDRNEGANQNTRHQTVNIDRVAQLEQNMKFLQEQHQTTLIALHQEVESLRQKNRDLQFQLVFSKGSTYVPSSPSSPEDNGIGFMKSKGSPICVNITPLQIELLEKDLQDTKISLQEIKIQNQNLSEIIELQKIKLSAANEQKRDKQPMIDVGIQVENRLDPDRADLVACLEDATAQVTRLYKRNREQRKEISTLEAVVANVNGNKGARSHHSHNCRHGHNCRHSRGSPTSSTQEQATNKFPPLLSQSYWHRRVPRNGRNRHDKSEQPTEMDSTVLPQLQNVNMKTDPMIFESPFYRSRGYRNYYRDDSNRKYRGQASHKDRRDSENHHHRRDYKDGSSKVHQKEFSDSAEGSREGDTSASNKS